MSLPSPAGLGELLPMPFEAHGPSFASLLARVAPERLPDLPDGVEAAGPVDGTTVLALTCEQGVVIAGDRRATAGTAISKRDMRKVFQADRWSAVAVAGTAGPAMELAKVLATELEHYEKVEGGELSMEGKATKLASLVRAHLPMALQGLAVVPLLAGADPEEGAGRIFELDVVGGSYEERRFAATGSGARDARGSLKSRYREGLGVDDAVALAVEALWDAADEDAATGGPDTVRGIYPIVAAIDAAEGYREVPEGEVAEVAGRIAAERAG